MHTNVGARFLTSVLRISFGALLVFNSTLWFVFMVSIQYCNEKTPTKECFPVVLIYMLMKNRITSLKQVKPKPYNSMNQFSLENITIFFLREKKRDRRGVCVCTCVCVRNRERENEVFLGLFHVLLEPWQQIPCIFRHGFRLSPRLHFNMLCHVFC